jgi:5'-phosphate synthase pdxT subunit
MVRLKIGVLALQGAFEEHIALLRRLGVEALPVRLPQALEGLDALIIPGGESTTIARLMLSYNLTDTLRSRIQEGLAVLGTCAGMILLAKRVSDGLETLGVMDIEVRRNAFGRQVDSFETDLSIPPLGEDPFHGVFIRAPLIERASPEVEILSRLPDGVGVVVKQGKLLASAFHPELTDDLRFHSYFLKLASDGG